MLCHSKVRLQNTAHKDQKVHFFWVHLEGPELGVIKSSEVTWIPSSVAMHEVTAWPFVPILKPCHGNQFPKDSRMISLDLMYQDSNCGSELSGSPISGTGSGCKGWKGWIGPGHVSNVELWFPQDILIIIACHLLYISKMKKGWISSHGFWGRLGMISPSCWIRSIFSDGNSNIKSCRCIEDPLVIRLPILEWSNLMQMYGDFEWFALRSGHCLGW